MLCDRLRGVLRQYPNPEVAFYTTEICLGEDRSQYLLVAGIFQPEGRTQARADLAELHTDLPSYVGGMLDKCEWYTTDGAAALRRDSAVQALVPWVARLVNAWLKQREPLPVIEQASDQGYAWGRPRPKRTVGASSRPSASEIMGRIPTNTDRAAEQTVLYDYYEPMQKLARKITEIADWVRVTRPNLLPMTLNQVLYRVGRWHGAMRRMKEAKARPTSPMVFSTEGFQVLELTTREALEHEGETQGHCVGTYWNDVCAGSTRIFSLVTTKGETRATIEVRDGLVMQIKGPRNREVRREDELLAIADFLRSLGIPVPYRGLIADAFEARRLRRMQGREHEEPQ